MAIVGHQSGGSTTRRSEKINKLSSSFTKGNQRLLVWCTSSFSFNFFANNQNDPGTTGIAGTTGIVERPEIQNQYGTVDPDPHRSALFLIGWIRIRIQEGKNDPQNKR